MFYVALGVLFQRQLLAKIIDIGNGEYIGDKLAAPVPELCRSGLINGLIRAEFHPSRKYIPAPTIPGVIPDREPIV